MEDMFSQSSFFYTSTIFYKFDTYDKVELKYDCSVSNDHYFRQCSDANFMLVHFGLSRKTWVSEKCAASYVELRRQYTPKDDARNNQQRN